MTPVEINVALMQILTLRSAPAYHAAEVMRRSVGEVVMANAKPGTAQHSNIRLLIGTWETIATRVLANDDLKIPFYDSNPAGHMWLALEPAIEILRKRKIRVKAGKKTTEVTPSEYAAKFERLNELYGVWLAGQPSGYQGQLLAGINAIFG